MKRIRTIVREIERTMVKGIAAKYSISRQEAYTIVKDSGFLEMVKAEPYRKMIAELTVEEISEVIVKEYQKRQKS